MKPIFKSPFFGALYPGLRYLISITMSLSLLAGCGGVDKIVLTNGATSGPVNPLTIASADFLFSSGTSCNSSLALTNPDAQSYQFTYRYDGLNAAGRTIATVVFQNTIDPNTTHVFDSSWQISPALNLTSCTSITKAIVNGVPSVTLVAPVAVRQTGVTQVETSGSGREPFSGVWISRGTTSAWAINVDKQGGIFAQDGRGCVVEGAIGQPTGVDGVFHADLRRTLCGQGLEHFSGVALVDPSNPLDLYIWSHDAQDQQFDLVATR